MNLETKIIQIQGTAAPLPGDDIDTDQIMPARYLKEITFDKMGEYLFNDLRFDEAGKSKNYIIDHPTYKNISIFLVGNNFGCGSSREHAPQGIKRYGIKAIIGLSFAEIFAGNCKSLGIPLLTVTPDVLAQLSKIVTDQPTSLLTIDLKNKTVTVANQTFSVDLSEARRKSFLEGTWDAVALLKHNSDKVDALVSRLPYLNAYAG